VNHHSYVAHLDVQSLFLLHHVSLILLTSSLPCLQLLVEFLLHDLPALNLLGLGNEFLLDYLCVSFIEVLVQIIFDEDERHHKVVSCMVGDAIVIEKMVQALSQQVVLHKLMIGLTVILVPYTLLMILSRNIEVVAFLSYYLRLFRLSFSRGLLPFRPLRLPDLFVFGNSFCHDLILLQRSHKTLQHRVSAS